MRKADLKSLESERLESSDKLIWEVEKLFRGR